MVYGNVDSSARGEENCSRFGDPNGVGTSSDFHRSKPHSQESSDFSQVGSVYIQGLEIFHYIHDTSPVRYPTDGGIMSKLSQRFGGVSQSKLFHPDQGDCYKFPGPKCKSGRDVVCYSKMFSRSTPPRISPLDFVHLDEVLQGWYNLFICKDGIVVAVEDPHFTRNTGRTISGSQLGLHLEWYSTWRLERVFFYCRSSACSWCDVKVEDEWCLDPESKCLYSPQGSLPFRMFLFGPSGSGKSSRCATMLSSATSFDKVGYHQCFWIGNSGFGQEYMDYLRSSCCVKFIDYATATSWTPKLWMETLKATGVHSIMVFDDPGVRGDRYHNTELYSDLFQHSQAWKLFYDHAVSELQLPLDEICEKKL